MTAHHGRCTLDHLLSKRLCGRIAEFELGYDPPSAEVGQQRPLLYRREPIYRLVVLLQNAPIGRLCLGKR